MTFEAFLQFLNLPILGGIIVVAYQGGKIVRQIDDHERRLEELEDRASWKRRQGDLEGF